MENESDDGNYLITASNVKHQSDSEKLVFIQYVISLPESEVFANLTIDLNLNEKNIRKIYYDDRDIEKGVVRRNWIYYEDKAIYCVYCLCFGIDSKQNQSCSFVYGQKFEESFYRLMQKIRRHETSEYHEASEKQFMARMGNYSIQSTNPRIVVKTVMQAILFLATHKLAFRGDRFENVFKLNLENSYLRSDNEGNFLGLIKLLSAHNTILAEHLKNCQELEKTNQKDLTYLSPQFLNKVLEVTRKLIVDKIVYEIKINGNRFGLQMDTSQDVTTKEYCSVVARYVNRSEICERMILFIQVQETTGEGNWLNNFNLLDASLHTVGLSVKNIIGYSFDGAGNMRSVNKGVNHFIQKANPESIYTWCFVHRFNLVIKDAVTKFFKIRYTLGLAQETAVFLKASHIRMDIWTNIATSTPGFNSLTRLKLIGQTRWSSKQNAVHNIAKTPTHLFVLIKTLTGICCIPSLEGAALTTACALLNSWLDYENIMLLLLLDKIFSLLNITTKNLQSSAVARPGKSGLSPLWKSLSPLWKFLSVLDTCYTVL